MNAPDSSLMVGRSTSADSLDSASLDVSGMKFLRADEGAGTCVEGATFLRISLYLDKSTRFCGMGTRDVDASTAAVFEGDGCGCPEDAVTDGG